MAKRIIQDKTVKFFIVIIGLVFIAMILKELQNIFIPFVIAYFLFFLFHPLNNFLERKKFPLFSRILIDVIILLLLTAGIINFLIGTLTQFINQLPAYADKLNLTTHSLLISLGINDPAQNNFSIQGILKKLDYKMLAGSVFSSTFGLISAGFFILFFFIFIVTGHNNIYEAIKKRYVYKKVSPELKKMKKKYAKSTVSQTEIDQLVNNKFNIEKNEKEEKLANTFKEINDQIKRYIIAKILINLSAGIIVTLALSIFGIDFAIVWGLFVFLLNFIPSIGSAAALIFPTLMALLQFGSFGYTALIAVIMGIIQTIFFNIIEPMVIGKRLKLNPLLILFSVLVWGYLWGIVGMLLSVPLTAIIKIIISNSESKNLQFISDLMS